MVTILLQGTVYTTSAFRIMSSRWLTVILFKNFASARLGGLAFYLKLILHEAGCLVLHVIVYLVLGSFYIQSIRILSIVFLTEPESGQPASCNHLLILQGRRVCADKPKQLKE